MSDSALDTSVAVPYLLRSHDAHQLARHRVGQRRPTLTGHSLAVPLATRDRRAASTYIALDVQIELFAD